MPGPADGAAPLVDDAAGQLHLAELAVADVLDGLDPRAAGAALRPGLADPAVLAGRLDDPPAFADVVADRLLDVDVLAGLHGPDRGQGVPVVGRGDGDDVDGLVVEHGPQVLDRLRGRTPLLDELGGDFRRAVAVGIADVGDLAVRQAGQFLRVLLAADAAADDGRGDLVVGGDGRLVRAAISDLGGRRGGGRGRGEERVFQEPAASRL